MKALELLLEKYNWTHSADEKSVHVYNSKNVYVLKVWKGGTGTYKIFDGADNLLMSGNKDMISAVEQVMVQYFYAKKLSA